jgi:hypothetical protein
MIANAYDPLYTAGQPLRSPGPDSGKACFLTVDMDHGDVHPNFGLGASRRKGMFDEMARY